MIYSIIHILTKILTVRNNFHEIKHVSVFKPRCLVVEEFNSTKVVLDPLPEDGVLLSSISQLSGHTSADDSVKPEAR